MMSSRIFLCIIRAPLLHFPSYTHPSPSLSQERCTRYSVFATASWWAVSTQEPCYFPMLSYVYRDRLIVSYYSILDILVEQRQQHSVSTAIRHRQETILHCTKKTGPTVRPFRSCSGQYWGVLHWLARKWTPLKKCVRRVWKKMNVLRFDLLLNCS